MHARQTSEFIADGHFWQFSLRGISRIVQHRLHPVAMTNAYRLRSCQYMFRQLGSIFEQTKPLGRRRQYQTSMSQDFISCDPVP